MAMRPKRLTLALSPRLPSTPAKRRCTCPMLKAELHVHLEGTLTPKAVRAIAADNGIDSPDDLFDMAGRYRWHDFPSFLAAYDRAAGVIRQERDYYSMTADYLDRLAAEGAIYAELTISPDHAALHGLSYTALTGAVGDAIREARARTGIEARMLVTCIRHFGPDRALALARTVRGAPHPLVTGFGMAGNEAIGDIAEFAPAFMMAHIEAGLGVTVHAGEFAGAESVRAALDHLPVSRIGHGVRAIEDPDTVTRLIDRGIVLEVCPGSNLALGVYADAASHPLRTLKRLGCAVTVNSDDPPFFDTSLAGEYALAHGALGLTRDEVAEMTRTAVNAAFVDDDARARLLDRLDREDAGGLPQ